MGRARCRPCSSVSPRRYIGCIGKATCPCSRAPARGRIQSRIEIPKPRLGDWPVPPQVAPPLLGRTGTAFDPAGRPPSVEPAGRRSEGHRRPRGFSVRSASPHSICLAGVSGCQFADQRPMVAGRNDPRVQQRGLRAPRWVRGFRPRHGSIAALCCVAEETRLSCTARRRRQSAMQETGAWGMGLHSPHEIARFRVAQHRSLSAPPRRVTRRRPNTTRHHRAAVTRP